MLSSVTQGLKSYFKVSTSSQVSKFRLISSYFSNPGQNSRTKLKICPRYLILKIRFHSKMFLICSAAHYKSFGDWWDETQHNKSNRKILLSHRIWLYFWLTAHECHPYTQEELTKSTWRQQDGIEGPPYGFRVLLLGSMAEWCCGGN